MGRTGDGTLRRIEALFQAGRAGSWSDGRLLASFADGRGVEREDAFAALVRRHGPMVLATCRRMLGASPDADDAFQAVFVVLARKAGSLRDADDVGGWLRTVAVRTGREARARAARVRAREGAGLGDAHAAPGVDPDLFELRSALDEELERLPGGFREVIRLCALEGLSRREAAERLGLAEGTLSSRLARGRTLLRDRLARRGLAVGLLGAALATEPRAALADAALRLALQPIQSGAAPGTVSEAVASLAEGAFAMLASSRWRSFLTSAGMLGAVVVAVGLALAYAAPAPEARPFAAPVPASPASAAAPVRVFVLDAFGEPVEGAEVRLNPYTFHERIGRTDAGGSCAFVDPPGAIEDRSILARVGDAPEVGAWRWLAGLPRSAAAAPIGIVLKPAREVQVRVVDVHGGPVAGAEVEAVAEARVVAHAEAGGDGRVRLLVPADEEDVQWIAARGRGVGFGYVEFGEVGMADRSRGVAAVELPDSLEILLLPQDPFQIRVVDGDGSPIPGAEVVPIGGIWLAGKRRGVAYPGRLLGESSGPDGIAAFDWFPRRASPVEFRASSSNRSFGTTLVHPDSSGPVLARAGPAAVIRGKVARPDGSPAPAVRVEASRGSTWTAADGTYAIQVPPGESQAVWAADDEFAAPARMDVVATPDAPAEVDFQLVRGAMIRGVISRGPDRRPVPNHPIFLIEDVSSAPIDRESPRPEDLKVLRSMNGSWMEKSLRMSAIPTSGPTTRRVAVAWSDDRGRYAIPVVPGTYQLRVEGTDDAPPTVVRGEAEIVRDFHQARARSRRPLVGRVVDERGRPSPGAAVDIVGKMRWWASRPLVTDAEGVFRAELEDSPQTVAAASADGASAGLVEIGVEDVEVAVVVKPAARATGVFLDRDGQPRPWQSLVWEPRDEMVHSSPITTWGQAVQGPAVMTDAAGRFTSPPLVVGVEYVVRLASEILPAWGSSIAEIRNVLPERPGTFDLGGVRVDERPYGDRMAERMRERAERSRPR